MKQFLLNNSIDNPINAYLSKLKVSKPYNKRLIWDNIKIKTGISTKYYATKKLANITIAASILIFIGLTVIINHDTQLRKAEFGEQLSVVLPDGSHVVLNSGSQLAYSKYQWQKNRRLKLKGEAFFRVKKGETFIVETQNGIVSVLGTSFNVFSRDSLFNVACYSGKVCVQDQKQNSSVILLPHENTSLANRKLTKYSNYANEMPGWLTGEFYYRNVPLQQVFNELERQFNIEIKYTGSIENNYTGYFFNNNINQALTLVCSPFGFDYEIDNKNKKVKIY